jgi:hypothetical protein
MTLHVAAGFKGDVYLVVKLLLPTAGKKRVYNLQSKLMVKLLSQVSPLRAGLHPCTTVHDIDSNNTVRTLWPLS